MTQISATTNTIEVVIQNIGDAPVADSFWVDLYLNPSPAPTQVNQIWPDLASYGLVWGVNTIIPANGGSLTLTMNDAYYYAVFSTFSTPLPVGSVIYVQVDSVNRNTNYGGVLEKHELTGDPYNNIGGPITSSNRRQQ